MQKEDYEKEWSGLHIKYLITFLSGSYIIFIDNENDLDWRIKDWNIYSKEQKININKIKNEVDLLETLPLDKLDDRTIMNFKRQLGEILSRIFDNDYENAIKMLDYAKDYIQKRNLEQSRSLFVISAGIITIISVSIFSLLFMFKNFMMNLLGTSIFFITVSTLIGSLGAFFSILLRIEKTLPDYNATKKLHYLEGITRVITGMISSFFIVLCIQSELLLPIFTKIESTNIAMILAGFIAGTSERLAPSIINSLTNKIDTTLKKQ